MTPEQAATLKSGDPVTIAHGPTNAGRVLRLIGDCVIIRWRAGEVVCYSLSSMPHIERTPEATHD